MNIFCWNCCACKLSPSFTFNVTLMHFFTSSCTTHVCILTTTVPLLPLHTTAKAFPLWSFGPQHAWSHLHSDQVFEKRKWMLTCTQIWSEGCNPAIKWQRGNDSLLYELEEKNCTERECESWLAVYAVSLQQGPWWRLSLSDPFSAQQSENDTSRPTIHSPLMANSDMMARVSLNEKIWSLTSHSPSRPKRTRN